ncbi:MAG TPA: hypothetical protein PK573_16355 [Spirochaetota bacterium]|nr:hypothetical protein [Spirochaetota bacterium]
MAIIEKITGFFKSLSRYDSFKYISLSIAILVCMRILMEICYINAAGIAADVSAPVVRERVWKYKSAGLQAYAFKNKKIDRRCSVTKILSACIPCLKEDSGPEKDFFKTEAIFSNNVKIEPAEKKIILLKLLEIKAYAERHLKFAVFLYKQYYVMIMMVAILSAIGAGLLLLVGKDGWKDAKWHVKTAFVIVSAGVLFFFAIPRAFEFQNNITSNLNSYIYYVNMENKTLSFVLNDKNFQNQKKVADFISVLDNDMAKVNNLSMSIDFSKAMLDLKIEKQD